MYIVPSVFPQAQMMPPHVRIRLQAVLDYRWRLCISQIFFQNWFNLIWIFFQASRDRIRRADRLHPDPGPLAAEAAVQDGADWDAGLQCHAVLHGLKEHEKQLKVNVFCGVPGDLGPATFWWPLPHLDFRRNYRDSNRQPCGCESGALPKELPRVCLGTKVFGKNKSVKKVVHTLICKCFYGKVLKTESILYARISYTSELEI